MEICGRLGMFGKWLTGFMEGVMLFFGVLLWIAIVVALWQALAGA